MPVPITVKFLGAAGSVTGSRFLVETGRVRVLVDCGLCQERDNLCHNWEPFEPAPPTLSSVVLTHAHLDHSGWLPRLVHEGFAGPVFCTPPTAEIARLILADSAKVMEEDAENKRRRHERQGRRGRYPEVPLYSADAARAASRLFQPVAYGAPFHPGGRTGGRLHDAGHILGSATVTLTVPDDGNVHTILFSGDLGRPGKPVLKDPQDGLGADTVVVEATYGDRSHPEADVEDQLAAVINGTVARGGNVVIPSFAIERAQELLFHLGRLVRSGRVPLLPVFVDSPLAASVTEVFSHHPGYLDEDLAALFSRGLSPFDFPGLRFVRTPQESEGINTYRGSTVIIAGSGMATGGRIKRHLINNIGRAESTVLFVGYQANGTLGRSILDGQKPVRILGEMHAVRARVERIDAFSAHADREGLLDWLLGLRPSPRRVFIVHAEQAAASSFASLARERLTQAEVLVPAYGDSFNLD
jgi:metallo-beta-lactamase family protein